MWLWCQAKTSKWTLILSLVTEGVGRSFWPCMVMLCLLFPYEGSGPADCHLHERLCSPVWEVVAGQFNHRGWYFHRHCTVTGKTRLLYGGCTEILPSPGQELHLLILVSQFLRHFRGLWNRPELCRLDCSKAIILDATILKYFRKPSFFFSRWRNCLGQ